MFTQIVLSCLHYRGFTVRRQLHISFTTDKGCTAVLLYRIGLENRVVPSLFAHFRFPAALPLRSPPPPSLPFPDPFAHEGMSADCRQLKTLSTAPLP